MVKDRELVLFLTLFDEGGGVGVKVIPYFLSYTYMQPIVQSKDYENFYFSSVYNHPNLTENCLKLGYNLLFCCNGYSHAIFTIIFL